MGKKIVILALYTFFAGFIVRLAAQHLPVTTYNPRNGAMINGAINIFQDKTGWMWFTNGYNVVRYDGNSFRIFEPSKNTKLNFCYKILQAGGEIWVLSNPYPLKVVGDSLYPLHLQAQLPLSNVLEHNRTEYVLAKNGLYFLKKEQFIPFITDASLSFSRSPTTLISYRDSLLLTYQPDGVIVFDPIKKTFHRINLPVLDLQHDKEGIIYMLVEGAGLVRINNLDLSGLQPVLSLDTIYASGNLQECGFTVDRQKTIWFFERFNSLRKIKDGEVITFTEKDGLPNLWFSQLYPDREGNVWVGFIKGLCKISNPSWERYTQTEGLNSNHLVFFNRDKAGHVFITTAGGLNIFENGKISSVTKNGKPLECKDIIQVKQDYFFIRDTLFCKATIDFKTRKVISEKCFSLPGEGIQLASDSRGNVYIATINGLWLYNEKGLRKAIEGNAYYRFLLIDKTDKLWVGEFGGGLHGYIINSDEKQNPVLKNVISLDTILNADTRLWAIRSISTDNRGNVLVGTRYNGLFHLKFSGNQLLSIHHYDEKQGLNSNNIWGTDIDSAGNFWIATSKGLLKLFREKNNWILSDEGTSRQIYSASHVFTSGNTIWVGNYPGMVIIKKNTNAAEPFSVFISKSIVNGKPVVTSMPGKFSHKENNLSLEFSANSFLDEPALLYSYYLKGSKFSNWSQLSSSHTLNFSSLSPGEYELKVKALNANGQWSQNEARYHFTILRPFWRQTWFMIAVLLFICSGLIILYRYRVNRLKELYEMRNIIARDLHDEIGSTLTSINILSKVSQRNLEKKDAKTAELLQKVVEQSHQIQQNMSDIVWAVRPDNDRMENMVIRMREYLSHTLEPKNIAIQFSADESIMQESLTMQQRRDFFLIFKEAVNNIAKYSHCGQTQVKLMRQKGYISLSIRDNGIGFDDNKVGSSGLKNMKHRAALLKGSLNIHSSPDQGTQIELLVPAT